MLPKRDNAARAESERVPFLRHTTHHQVLHEVGERILCGVFSPGEIMPSETALSDELRVSRPVLREAIKVLAAKGLVDSRPKIGTRVKQREDWNMLDPDILAWGFASPEAEQYAIALSEMRTSGYQNIWVLIQFGHNDQPGKPGRSTDLATGVSGEHGALR